MLELLESGRLEIRKTKKPNHAKLYIFRVDKSYYNLLQSFFITGSSNLTIRGLKGQDELNVLLRDYGVAEVQQYFDTSWNNAIKFDSEDKQKLIYIITEETHIKKITPFEAYLYILQTYLKTYQIKDLRGNVEEQMKKAGYTPYLYQIDVICQALSILEIRNGVIIADVVGLEKSIIASLIASQLKKRGIVISPPALIGPDDKSYGWKKYIEDFGLSAIGWEFYSLGILEEMLSFVNKASDIAVVIIYTHLLQFK